MQIEEHFLQHREGNFDASRLEADKRALNSNVQLSGAAGYSADVSSYC